MQRNAASGLFTKPSNLNMRHIFVEYFNELYHIAVFTRYTE